MSGEIEDLMCSHKRFYILLGMLSTISTNYTTPMICRKFSTKYNGHESLYIAKNKFLLKWFKPETIVEALKTVQYDF